MKIVNEQAVPQKKKKKVDFNYFLGLFYMYKFIPNRNTGKKSS